MKGDLKPICKTSRDNIGGFTTFYSNGQTILAQKSNQERPYPISMVDMEKLYEGAHSDDERAAIEAIFEVAFDTSLN